jgi:hypothetical protein
MSVKTVGDVMEEIDHIQQAIEWMRRVSIVFASDEYCPCLRDDVVLLLSRYQEMLKTTPIQK